MTYQSRDIRAALTQWRQPDRGDIQAIEQIVAKLPLPNQM
jgi:hypothetical protein